MTYNISAGTDHDFIPGTVVHASVIIQQTGNDGSQNNTSYNVELQPGQAQNLYVFAKEEGSISAEAECWDDPMYTYGFTSSEEAVYTDTTVVDAPLSPMDGMSSFFDYTDTSPGATAPRPVAEFFDANPDAQASDFSVQSIDWGDGTTPDQGGSVQKDGDGVGWDVIAYHDYGGPNPATSLDGDGSWPISASVMDKGGATVAAQGKAAVNATKWINCTKFVGGGPLDPTVQSNDTITVKASTTDGLENVFFDCTEYEGKPSGARVQNPQVPILAAGGGLAVMENLATSNAYLPGNPLWITVQGECAHKDSGGNVVSYDWYDVAIQGVTNAWNGHVLNLDITDVNSNAVGHMRINFSLLV